MGALAVIVSRSLTRGAFIVGETPNPSVVPSSLLRTADRARRTTRLAIAQSFSSSPSLVSDDEEEALSFSRSPTLHTVMVRRNRQSQAFREGSQLAFGGAVSSTYTELCGPDRQRSKDPASIPIGSMVALVVSRDKQSNQQRKAKGKRDSHEAVAPHFTFASDDFQTRDVINKSQLIGYGVWNPQSMYRVRILAHETTHPNLAKEIRQLRKQVQRGETEDVDDIILRLILRRKVSDAILTRLALDLPADDTNTYRLINGEGDGLSGLAVDVIGGTHAIIMSSAAWVEIHKCAILSEIENALKEAHEEVQFDVIWRNTPSRLKQDGFEMGEEKQEADPRSDVEVTAMESGVRYHTFPYADGQKTGFYCDQRENRRMVAELCAGKRVLDLCCYNGGFALNAVMRGSALSATGVDSSQDAVDAATKNAELNGCSAKTTFVRDDVANYMRCTMEKGEDYDVIVLDPPKLAPSVSSLDKASRKYHALNRDAMNVINPTKGGLLLTCTCSAAMSQKDGGQFFLNVVNGAALSAKRRVTLLRVSGAASCHTQSPASWPAGAYLTAALFHVGPITK